MSCKKSTLLLFPFKVQLVLQNLKTVLWEKLSDGFSVLSSRKTGSSLSCGDHGNVSSSPAAFATAA